MAIPGHSADLWAHVQRRHLHAVSSVRLVPPQRTIGIDDEGPGWHIDRYEAKAGRLLAAWEAAVAAGKDRRGRRLRSAWMHTLHLDRVAFAREAARERGLRLDPMGRGPLVDRPTVHYRDRLPWGLTPVNRHATAVLPDPAANVVETWNGTGWIFDALYIADEPVSSGHFPVHSLIGAISPCGRTADWFVLDRWAS